MSPYIAPTWNHVGVIQRKRSNDSNVVTLRDALKEYTLSTNKFKKIVCKKQLTGWDMKQLKNEIKQTIYRADYQGNIDVVR